MVKMATVSASAGRANGMSTYLFEVLSCPVCLEMYTDPKLLVCGHTLCGNCVQNLVKRARSGGTIRFVSRSTFLIPVIPCSCPQCRHEMPADTELRTNFALNDVLCRYTFLDRQSTYRHCTVCRQMREKRSIFQAIGWLQAMHKRRTLSAVQTASSQSSAIYSLGHIGKKTKPWPSCTVYTRR